MTDWSQSSAHHLMSAISAPCVSASIAEPLSNIYSSPPRGHLISHYRGSTPARPRHGVGTRRANCGRKVDARPQFRLALDEAIACRISAIRLGDVALPSDDGDAWAGIPCWTGQIGWLAQVYWAYRRHYERLRPFFCSRTGTGGVSLTAVLRVAAIRAKYADTRTGRNSFPSVVRIMREADLGKRTVQRATKFLRMTDCATEVLRGRLRTLDERLNCHQIGDKARGWTSVYALHPPRDVRVIHNAHADFEGTKIQMTPHLSGDLLSSLPPFMQNSLTKTNSVGRLKRTAPRRTAHTKRKRAEPPSPKAALLAAQWLRDDETPRWAHRHSRTTWAYVCESLAAQGWCARDINQMLTDHVSAGGWIATNPGKPIALVRWIISRIDDLANRPAAADMAREAGEAARAKVNTPPASTFLASLGPGSTSEGRQRARAIFADLRR